MALDFSKFGTPVEQSSALDFSKFGTPVQPPEKESAFRQIADVPLGIAKGAVQGVRMIADAFGAGSDTSKTIKSAETYLADLMSAQAKNDQQEIARIMKDAEDKGVLDQVKAGIKAFTVAPIDTLSSALGTAAPVIAGALGAKVLGAGALVSTGVSALTGAGMGAGVVKGSIYEETKNALKEAGASEQDAEARAKLAQEYGGKNLDQILLGTVLGGAAAVGPLEKGGAAILARRILGKTGTEATETVATEAAKGAVRRRLEAGALEAVPEAIQAGQEQVAQNIALQREGFDVPTFRGAVSAATLEGIAGGGLGAAVGGGKPAVAPEAEPAPPVAPPLPPEAPEAELEQLTPQQKQELERQRALRERPQTTEELLAGITPAPTTTPLDVARIRDEHETAVIEGLLAQDAEMKLANDFARRQLELESEAEATAGGISDVDTRVREGRIFSRVQDLIDRNIPYASTAINDINQKFGVINEAPLTEEERARVDNIMGMVSTFTNFVNLPVLAPKPMDPFAENQQMEALIRERTESGQAQPIRTAPAAPSPSVQETPVSQGVGEGPAIRPPSGVEPSVAEDRELVTAPAPAAVETPAPAAEAPVAAPAVEPTPAAKALEPTPITPAAEAPATVEAPKIITTQVLTELGVKPTAAVVKRLEGKVVDDPEVVTQLETYANRYAAPEVKPAILSFIETIKAPTAAPVAAEPAPAAPPSRSSEAWRTEGKTPEQLMADKVESVSSELAAQIADEASAQDFAPNELPTAIQQWASDAKVPADDLRFSVIKALDRFDISDARKAQVNKALSPLRSAPEVPALEPAAPTAKTPSERQEQIVFGKAIGAAQPYPGELRGRVNLPAQKAAKEGDFQGVLSALEKSKNVIVAEIAKRAKSLGTKIVIDDNAEETYTGPSELMRQMSIDGAKMHLEALEKIRALAPKIDALPDGFRLGYDITGEKINAIDQGKDAGRMSLGEIADMGHSMFAPLATGPFKLKTKEDFKRLQKAYEDLTSEYGENALQLTSTGSAEMRGVAGAYDADTDTIRVPEYTAKREEVLSHEIVHAQTVQSIANPTLRQKPIVARLNKLYEHVKKELEGRPGRAPYGIQSIQEFVAEGMGNPAFQFLLKKIKYENTSAWDSFVQTIANLIGVKRDTAFTELLSIYSDLTTEQKAAAPTVEAAAPKAEAPKPELSDFQKRLKDYWNNTATPAIRNYLSAINSFGIERLEKNFVKPAGMTPREWLESFVSMQPTWDKGRKTGATGIQTLSTKNLWPTTDGSGERLRKAMLEAVKALKNAPGSTGELVSEAFGEKPTEAKSLGGERAQVQAFEQTLRSLLNKFGLKDVGLKIQEGMTDSGSYAAQIIKIAADAANPVRTLRHEAIHALRELGFFTDAQWSSLSKMAKDKWIDQYLKQRNVDGKPLKAGEESRYDAYMREYNGDMEKITEEAVGDAFADFDATKPPAGMLQALLKRMKDLFQSIKSALTKVESPEQIFGKVEKGELKEGAREAKGEAKSLRDRATANFKRWFGDSKVVDEKGEPLVVYHGTGKDIEQFLSQAASGQSGRDRNGPTNWGIYFTADPSYAAGYAGLSGAVYPVYLSVQNPKIIRKSTPGFWERVKRKVDKKYGAAAKSREFFDSIESVLIRDEDLVRYRAEGYDGIINEAKNEIVVFDPTQIKSAIGNNGDYSLTTADIRKSIGGRNPGEQAISIVNSLGMGVKPPEPGRAEKAMKMLKDAGENPSLTKESAKKTLTKWLDWFETTVFSSDSAFNNKIRRGIISDFKQNPEVLGMLLEASQSQTVHADALASQFMIDGGLQYNDDLKKWESVKKEDNFVALAKKIEDLAKKYNVTKDEMERIAHTYFVAKRLPGIIKRNEELDAEIKAERATAKPDRKQIEEWESLKVFVSDEQLAMMEPGLSLVKTIPELKEVVDIWQGIRKNNIDVMVNSGLWSPEYATAMWDNMDYVPYYREEQLEEGAGPQEFIRGLQVKSKEFQLKGSGAAVNDVFDNMIRWSQYAMNRAIRAHKATQMIDAALKIEVDGKPMATKVTEQKRGMNIVRAFRDGKQELYDMADPLFVPAFSSIQNVSIPTLTFMSKVSNVLRQSVVLYPLFSVAQVPQDSFAAMFSSGLKTQHALKIPYLAVKEFIKTLSKTSQTHNELTKYGVVGVRDFSATIIRNDAEIYAGLKPPKGGWGKTKEFMEHIAMSADNAVRQAVYEASMQQGLNKSEALEKAFEVINFRRRGTSKMLNVMGQTVPFFYAYLSAQRVAFRVLSGVGISPSDRKEALTTLATTSAAVAALSMIYAMANGDDEDYAETPAAIRDRTLTIPGSGGVRIPLRPDFFLFPKIVAEHTYLMLSDKGFEDGAKFRKSMADALLSAVASPTPFPTAIKPAIEVAINYDFFQGKPLIGNFEKQKDIERQFRDSTSELAKILSNVPLSYSLAKGKFEGLSPIAIDHMIRGMLGSFGGLLLFGTNQFLHSDPDVPRPELSANEMLAALPGTSGLLKRPQESALKNDFFVLRDEVEKAANTFSDIKNRSPEGIQAFLEDEKNVARLGLAKGVDKINRELSKIRRVMTQITNMPESQMSGDEKSENIRQLRELEREILRSVNVKELREMAKI